MARESHQYPRMAEYISRQDSIEKGARPPPGAYLRAVRTWPDPRVCQPCALSRMGGGISGSEVVGSSDRAGRGTRGRFRLRRTRENKNHSGQVSKGFQGRQRRGQCVTLAGRMISSDLGGAMVTNHLGKPSRRTIRCSRLFISSLLRRTPLL